MGDFEKDMDGDEGIFARGEWLFNREIGSVYWRIRHAEDLQPSSDCSSGQSRPQLTAAAASDSTQDHEPVDADAYVLVYDVANRATFERLSEVWRIIKPIVEGATASGEKVPAVVVVGHKIDLPETTWTVTAKEGLELAQALNGSFAQTSAAIGGIDGVGVEEMAAEVLKRIMVERMKVEVWEPPAQ